MDDPVSKIPLELRAWGTKSVLRGLLDDEALWRDRVGDEAYEQAVAYWRQQAEAWNRGLP